MTPAALVALLQHVKRRRNRAPLDRRSLTPDEFAALTGVSRETLARLQAYAGLLTNWSGASIWSRRARWPIRGAGIFSIRRSFIR